jgi:hypothetical protein
MAVVDAEFVGGVTPLPFATRLLSLDQGRATKTARIVTATTPSRMIQKDFRDRRFWCDSIRKLSNLSAFMRLQKMATARVSGKQQINTDCAPELLF